MSRRADYLRLRRELLGSLIEAQRTELGYLSARLHPPLRVLDSAVALGRAFRWYRTLALTASALMAGRRRNVFFWIGSAFTLWQLFARRRDRG